MWIIISVDTRLIDTCSFSKCVHIFGEFFINSLNSVTNSWNSCVVNINYAYVRYNIPPFQ